MSQVMAVKYWAPWCQPCKALAPVFDAAMLRHPGVIFRSVNVDEHDVQVTSVPTFAVLVDGVEVARQDGAMPPVALARWLDEAIAEARS